MVEYIRGLKAGFVSGLIFGIINAILGAFIYWFNLESIPGEMSKGLINVGIHTLYSLIPGKIIFGIIGGIIFGLIFAVFYSKIPGTKPIVNGITTAIIYWFIFSLIMGYFFQGYYLPATYGITHIADLIIGLVMFLFWSFLLVKLWDKFGKPTTSKTDIKR